MSLSGTSVPAHASAAREEEEAGLRAAEKIISFVAIVARLTYLFSIVHAFAEEAPCGPVPRIARDGQQSALDRFFPPGKTSKEEGLPRSDDDHKHDID